LAANNHGVGLDIVVDAQGVGGAAQDQAIAIVIGRPVVTQDDIALAADDDGGGRAGLGQREADGLQIVFDPVIVFIGIVRIAVGDDLVEPDALGDAVADLDADAALH